MRTRYESFPELSVDPCHFRLTEVSATPISIRFAGAVGAERSALPAETICPLKSSNAVNANAAVEMISRENDRVVIERLLLLTNQSSVKRQVEFIVIIRTQ